MSNTQPLISAEGRYSTDRSNKDRRRSMINKLSNCLQCFTFKKLDQQYETLDDDDDDNDHARTELVIGYFQLFRFADWLDFLIIAVGLCVVFLHSIASTAVAVVFGQVTSAFASQSFIDRCPLQQNASVTANNSTGSPWGTAENTLNYDRLQK
ncbi:unnamed protein product [Rotaria sordida]|uniref:Uncharacterized protein n=1 Tax=Rotaria sordida TaxID=392033 RepID=A0A819SEU1_9BILA|nr:unnamed protein product [Rotaria sordida]